MKKQILYTLLVFVIIAAIGFLTGLVVSVLTGDNNKGTLVLRPDALYVAPTSTPALSQEIFMSLAKPLESEPLIENPDESGNASKPNIRAELEDLYEAERLQKYVIGVYDGYVAVFFDYPEERVALKEVTNIPITSLPEEICELLFTGVKITGDDDLHKSLEDYGS